MNANNPLDELINDNSIDNQAITSTTQQNVVSNDNNKSVFAKCYDYAQQKLNVIYKCIEKYEIQLLKDEDIYKIFCLAIENNDVNKIKDILTKYPIILSKILCFQEYDVIKTAIKENNTVSVDAFLYCMFKQNKTQLISESLKEVLFIYACQHPDNYYSHAIINLYKSTAYFFVPSYLQIIHDLYLNKDITTAINTNSTAENRINSNKLFETMYCLSQSKIFKSIDYLDLNLHFLKSQTEDIFSSTKIFISNLKNVAIYLTSTYNRTKEKKFYTFGDETACLNMLDQLICLGIKEVAIYINPPDLSEMEQRKDDFYFYDYYEYNQKKDYIIKKLSLLLDGIDPSLGLPQSIIKNGCTIKIRFIDDIGNNDATWQEKIKYYIGIKYPNINERFFASIVNENLVLAFTQSNLLANSQDLNNTIKILPFSLNTKNGIMKFSKKHIKQDSTLKFKSPSYSILREQEVNLPLKYSGINAYKKWLCNLLIKTKSSKEAEILSKIINLIALNIKDQKIHHSAIYGVHHCAIEKNAESILSSWINSLNKLSSEINKPIFLSIISNTLSINKQQFNKKNAVVIDLSKYDYNNDYIGEIDYCLQNNKTIVLFFPSLPKQVFHYLIDNTTMPILVEGANITSYALQKCKPYLSVLPTGKTPIPKKMGDPWVAFLIEALSYKLLFDKNLATNFKKLFDYVTNFEYQQAIDYISQLKQEDKKADNERAMELFCKENSDKSPITETKEITLLSLLKKGDSLSENGRRYLLQALDPDFKSISSYIKNCLDKNSKEIYHARLMQHHVNLPINDKLVITLNKFINKFKAREDAKFVK